VNKKPLAEIQIILHNMFGDIRAFEDCLPHSEYMKWLLNLIKMRGILDKYLAEEHTK
jgi:hypothetical protein